MLALILTTKADKPASYANSTLIGGFYRQALRNPVLKPSLDGIVVPLSILSNWEGQIKEHCQTGAIKYHVYYDQGRSTTAEKMKKYDVVITTYQVVTQEHSLVTGQAHTKKRQKTGPGGLFDVQWKVSFSSGFFLECADIRLAHNFG